MTFLGKDTKIAGRTTRSCTQLALLDYLINMVAGELPGCVSIPNSHQELDINPGTPMQCR